jgi:hypothetical protein
MSALDKQTVTPTSNLDIVIRQLERYAELLEKKVRQKVLASGDRESQDNLTEGDHSAMNITK